MIIIKVLLVTIFFFFHFTHEVFAQEGKVIVITSIDELLWSIVKTVQYYSLPIMAVALVGLGVKLITSGDDNQAKQTVKAWMIKVLTGGVIIFGATTLASILKTAVGG